MGKELFIAEKPSVAREFAKTLGVNGNAGNGYLESNDYVVTWCVGHLVTMSYPEKYDLKELKDMIGFGGSPRASINLALAARTYAFIKRRGYVIPEDVRAVAHDVLRHRIGLTYEAEASNLTSDEIISKILNKVEVP